MYVRVQESWCHSEPAHFAFLLYALFLECLWICWWTWNLLLFCEILSWAFGKPFQMINRNSTHHLVVVLKGSEQTILLERKKKYDINIPTNQICSAFYIALNEKPIGNCRSVAFLLFLPFSIVLDYLFMTATIELHNKIQALSFQRIHIFTTAQPHRFFVTFLRFARACIHFYQRVFLFW